MKTFYEKIQHNLFCTKETMQNIFSVPEQDVLIRIRTAYTKWFSEPYLTDFQIVNFLKNEFKIQKTCAYHDLAIVKSLLGEITNASKDFTRYRVTEMLLQGFQLAENAKNQTEISKAIAFVKAAEALVKVHNLNQKEMDYIRLEDIIPIELEPPTEISVIGSKPVANLEELKEKLRKRYNSFD
jgi:hypothetical protein